MGPARGILLRPLESLPSAVGQVEPSLVLNPSCGLAAVRVVLFIITLI